MTTLVIAEHDNAQLKGATLNAVAAAAKIGGDVHVLVAGANARAVADQAAQAVQVSREVLARFVAEGPTEAELQAAKDNLIGGFALRIDSNAKLLGNVANIAWNGLPLDYLDHWTDRIQALTVNDIRAAVQRVLHPDRMVTVVLGEKNK